jgi:hypothetical protein
LPRRILRGFNQFVYSDGDNTYLLFTRRDIRRFRFYKGLQQWFDDNHRHLTNGGLEIHDAHRDAVKQSLYSLLDWILDHGRNWFILSDIQSFIDELQSNYPVDAHLSHSNVAGILESLHVNEYLDIEENKYRFSYRRLIELGDYTEVRLDDVPLKSIPQPQFVSTPYSDTDLETSPAFFKEDQIAPDDWHFVLAAIGDEIRVEQKPIPSKGIFEVKTQTIKEKLDIGRASHDMNTANGTLLNNFPLESGQVISSEDVITIGSTRILFKVM